MRIHHCGQQGTILLTSLITAMILGTILAGYLTLVATQSRLSARAQAWSLALGVAEAGIEEALTQINYTNELCSNGWESEGGFYTRTRYLGSNYYTVAISNASAPILISTGSVQLPIGAGYVERIVRVTTQRETLFSKAMLARYSINMNGNNIKTDSFDSTDTNCSTNGRYDASKAKAHGDIATNSGLSNSLALGNANIWGRISTGPAGSATLGANGAVGDVVWQTSGQHGIQPGWSSDDMNLQFSAVTPPVGAFFTPKGGTVDGTKYDYILDFSGYWLISGLANNQSLIVCSNVQAVLLVAGDIKLTGNSCLAIQTGGALKLYMQGRSADFGGQGIVNQNGRATNFFYYGLPSNSSLSLAGNSQFTGAIYAPNADFSLGGGGSGTLDFVGASVTATVTMNGHYNFHYDESLSQQQGKLIIASWNEL